MRPQYKQTRDELEHAGFTFHPGYVTPDGKFQFTDQETDAELTDLIVSGWILVGKGICEPPKVNPFKPLLAMALLGAGLLVARHFFGEQQK